MSATLPTLSEQAAPERTISAGGQDRLLDVVRSAAIARVVLWHTWSWFWLSWIPAMPAMFFTSGALLDRSLERRGWLKTVQQRLRRLMIPYWLYAGACWVVMLADGWRPTLSQGFTWLIPLGDPVGSHDLPGLWVPLWYIRAYLWFVLGSGIIRSVQRRVGSVAVFLSAVGVVILWWLSHQGHEVPLAIGDAVAYLPFVMAGMHYSSRGRSHRSVLLASLAVAAALGSLWVVQRFGPDDKVVNRSYLLTMLVGTAGIAAMVAFRNKVISATSTAPRLSSLIDNVNSHALTIYLWQGFGLITAQRLVDVRVANPIFRAALSLIVVVTLITGAVILFGWVEDWAARRTPRLPQLSRLAISAPPIAVLVVALMLPLPGDAQIEAPLSGRAVVARAGLIEEALESGANDPAPDPELAGQSTEEVLHRWVTENGELLARVGTDNVEVVVITPEGTTTLATWRRGSVADDSEQVDPMSSASESSASGPGVITSEVGNEDLIWWSMTKTVTAAWMMRLIEAGVVNLDDRLSEWVPEAPHAGEITLEELARHTSGIPSSLDGSFLDETPAAGIEKYYRAGNLEFRPGDGFNYSRIGYYLLALALERASSTTWVDAVRDMGNTAGVTVRFDEDQTPFDHVTDPDGHGYRGGLWSSGGLITSMSDSVKLLQWIFTRGLTPASVEAMTRFSADSEHWYYGLALMPTCPCQKSDGYIHADRFGLDAATGLYSVDGATGAVVMLRPDIWWADEEPVTEFYDLTNWLLDSASR